MPDGRDLCVALLDGVDGTYIPSNAVHGSHIVLILELAMQDQSWPAALTEHTWLSVVVELCTVTLQCQPAPHHLL